MDINSSGAGQRITIDLNALKNNYKHLQQITPNSECAVVVKANAYGLGLAPISMVLHDAGARSFFVAHVSEAIALREILSDVKIYALNGFVAEHYALYKKHNIIAVLGSNKNLAQWQNLTAHDSDAPQFALHFDTGMHRLGFAASDAARLPQSLNTDPVLILSHYACADEILSPLNAQQLQEFSLISQYFPNIPTSLSNSNGIIAPASQFSLTRAGIALYGGIDAPGISSVVKYEARVLQIQSVNKGESIGYGASFIAPKNMRVATISIGYADGLPRFISTAPHNLQPVCFTLAMQKAPIIGKISMDLTMIDVSYIDNAYVENAEFVEIFGEKQSLIDFANATHTISYEVLTSLSKRAFRLYNQFY